MAITIYGNLLDRDYTNVAYKKVTLKTVESDFYASGSDTFTPKQVSTKTDAEGYFVFDSVLEGTYSFAAYTNDASRLPQTSSLYLTVPTGSGQYNINDLFGVLVDSSSLYSVYTKAQSDARYWQRSETVLSASYALNGGGGTSVSASYAISAGTATNLLNSEVVIDNVGGVVIGDGATQLNTNGAAHFANSAVNIDASGNLTASNAKFNGNVSASIVSASAIAAITPTINGTYNTLFIQYANGSNGGQWAINPFIYGVSNGGLSFVDRLNNRTSLIVDSSGNVGINTTASLASKFHVKSATNTGNAITWAGGADGYNGFLGYSTLGNTVAWIGNDYNQDSGRFDIRMKGSGSADAKLTVFGNGNVSIGSTASLAKLYVNGNISASSVTASLLGTASYALNGGGTGTTLNTGSTYPITSSYSVKSVSSDTATNLFNSQVVIDATGGVVIGDGNTQLNVDGAAHFANSNVIISTAGAITASAFSAGQVKIHGGYLYMMGLSGSWFKVDIYEDGIGTGSLQLTAV